jgi:hypothetical protein
MCVERPGPTRPAGVTLTAVRMRPHASSHRRLGDVPRELPNVLDPDQPPLSQCAAGREVAAARQPRAGRRDLIARPRLLVAVGVTGQREHDKPLTSRNLSERQRGRDRQVTHRDPPPRGEEERAKRRVAPAVRTVMGRRDLGWWPRAIANTLSAGVRDESQPGFLRADPHGGVAVRPTARYISGRDLCGADGAYVRKTGLQPGLSRFRAGALLAGHVP